jgi:hypothetical protein
LPAAHATASMSNAQRVATQNSLTELISRLEQERYDLLIAHHTIQEVRRWLIEHADEIEWSHENPSPWDQYKATVQYLEILFWHVDEDSRDERTRMQEVLGTADNVQ